jgi:DNA-binding HxlR family transcriptional regulator
MRAVLERVGDKWSVLIVVLLSDGVRRFMAIKRALGITRSVLYRRLIALERDGLIRRAPMSTLPVVRGYALTDLGRSLIDAVVPLRTWVQTNVSAITMARAEFDALQRAQHPSNWK